MKLIVGLGNPGEKYENNRHNVGFMTVETLIKNLQQKSQNYNLKFKTNKKFDGELAEFEKLLLLKPMTYMNKSGKAVQKVMQFFRIAKDEVFIIHDDLDIRLGEYKLSKRGPKVHNGVNSIRMAIGEGFRYVRIGVDNRYQQAATSYQLSGSDYVLGDFLREERDIVDEVIRRVGMEIIERWYE